MLEDKSIGTSPPLFWSIRLDGDFYIYLTYIAIER
jgi:hypothetical protein